MQREDQEWAIANVQGNSKHGDTSLFKDIDTALERHYKLLLEGMKITLKELAEKQAEITKKTIEAHQTSAKNFKQMLQALAEPKPSRQNPAQVHAVASKTNAQNKRPVDAHLMFAMAMCTHNTRKGIVVTYKDDDNYLAVSPILVAMIASSAGMKVSRGTAKAIAEFLEANEAVKSRNGNSRLGFNKPKAPTAHRFPMPVYKIPEAKAMELVAATNGFIERASTEDILKELDAVFLNMKAGKLPIYYRQHDSLLVEEFGEVHGGVLIGDHHTIFDDTLGLIKGMPYNADEEEEKTKQRNERRAEQAKNDASDEDFVGKKRKLLEKCAR